MIRRRRDEKENMLYSLDCVMLVAVCHLSKAYMTESVMF